MSLCNKRQVSKLWQQENVLSRLEPPTGSHHFTKNGRFLVRLTLKPVDSAKEDNQGEDSRSPEEFLSPLCLSAGSWPLFASCFVVAWTTPEESIGTVFQVIWKGINSSEWMLLSQGEKSLYTSSPGAPQHIVMIVFYFLSGTEMILFVYAPH